MTDEAIQRLTERLEETITRSHSSLSKTYSDLQSDTLIRLSAIDEGMRGIQRRQDIANGRTAHLEEDLIKLREERAVTDTTLKNHIEYEEKREKKDDEGKTFWFRNVSWYAFLLVVGAFIFMLNKVATQL